MENGNITSTNPYNFTFCLPEKIENLADQYTNGPYLIYDKGYFLLPWLILRSLNNVNLVLMNHKDLHKRLLIMKVTNWRDEHAKNSYGVRYGIIDATVHYYYLYEWSPRLYYVSPSLIYDSYLIISSVKKERGDTEVLSIQALGDSVWVLVALSLLAVSAVSSYIANRKRMRRQSHFASFTESLWIHAADILNNSVACAKKVAVPLRYTRAWWLLGVTILIQFWCSGLKNNLLADDILLIDSLEDLMSNPKIICYFPPSLRFIKLLEDEDSKYTMLRGQLRRNLEFSWQRDEKMIEKLASGKAVVMVEGSSLQVPALFKKIKRNKRKLYVGKTKYEQFYMHMFFNKRLPRDIKERIDYLATRITETRQLEPYWRRGKFYKQGNVFESDASATSISFSPMNIAYLTVVFRLWFIGLSLATAAFFFEYFGTERWRERFSWTIYKICSKIEAKLEPYLT